MTLADTSDNTKLMETVAARLRREAAEEPPELADLSQGFAVLFAVAAEQVSAGHTCELTKVMQRLVVLVAEDFEREDRS